MMYVQPTWMFSYMRRSMLCPSGWDSMLLIGPVSVAHLLPHQGLHAVSVSWD